MRIAAAAATIAACILVSLATSGGDNAPLAVSNIAGASAPQQVAELVSDKQSGGVKPDVGGPAPVQRGNDRRVAKRESTAAESGKQACA